MLCPNDDVDDDDDDDAGGERLMFDLDAFIIDHDDINVTAAAAAAGDHHPGFLHWSLQTSSFDCPPDVVGLEFDSAFGDTEARKGNDTNKRGRLEPCGPSSSKACREKLRRDRLNDKFTELASILEPGRPPKIDKAAILNDAARMVTQLRTKSQNFKDSNSCLKEKIKELKAEKNELRDEKQRLKADKERLELHLKTMNAQPMFVPSPPAGIAAFAAEALPAGAKLVPFVGYPGVSMWQFLPPAAVDTSQDHALHPPVA